MAVGRGMQIDPGQHVLERAVDRDQAPVARQIDPADDIAGIDRDHHPAHAVGQRHGPDPFRDLAFLNVEFRVGEILDIAEMVEMGVTDEAGIHVIGRKADPGQNRLGVAPVLDPETVAQNLAIGLVVIAHIDHGDVIAALDDHIAIGQLHIALIMRAIKHAAFVVIGNIAVFQNPDRIVGHFRSPPLMFSAARLNGRMRSRHV